MVIPARNEASWVAGALASVAAQTWPADRLEAVVVDNGSTDGTAAAARAFIDAADGLRVSLVSEPVRGVSRAKNRGAASARGAWLLFLDADSRMAPDLVERVIERARAGARAGSIRIVADGGDRVDRAFFGLLEFGKRLFRIYAQMLFCERELFAALGGFDEALAVAEDRDLLTRCRRAGARLCQLRESWIATSPRRLHRLPAHLALPPMLARWALAHWGIGRRWRY